MGTKHFAKVGVWVWCNVYWVQLKIGKFCNFDKSTLAIFSNPTSLTQYTQVTPQKTARVASNGFESRVRVVALPTYWTDQPQQKKIDDAFNTASGHTMRWSKAAPLVVLLSYCCSELLLCMIQLWSTELRRRHPCSPSGELPENNRKAVCFRACLSFSSSERTIVFNKVVYENIFLRASATLNPRLSKAFNSRTGSICPWRPTIDSGYSRCHDSTNNGYESLASASRTSLVFAITCFVSNEEIWCTKMLSLSTNTKNWGKKKCLILCRRG